MDKLNILIIEGTARPKRLSINAAKLVEQVGKEYDQIQVTLIKPEDFDLPNDGDRTDFEDAKYAELTANADGFFIVTPEYNHSYPGSLKRLLDSEYKNYAHKPVALAGVSNGPWGGTRAIESLLHPLRTMKMVVTMPDSNFPKVQDLFDESGKLLDEKYIEMVRRSYAELIWMATVLKQARENDK